MLFSVWNGKELSDRQRTQSTGLRQHLICIRSSFACWVRLCYWLNFVSGVSPSSSFFFPTYCHLFWNGDAVCSPYPSWLTVVSSAYRVTCVWWKGGEWRHWKQAHPFPQSPHLLAVRHHHGSMMKLPAYRRRRRPIRCRIPISDLAAPSPVLLKKKGIKKITIGVLQQLDHLRPRD